MRLFVALPVAEVVRRCLSGATRTIACANESALDDVRWVRPENLHITLKFLGEVPEAQVPRVTLALARTATPGPIVMRADRLALQPRRGPARLIAADIGGDTGAMQRLQGSTERALEDVGFSRERRAFWPHVTLGRSRSGIHFHGISDTLTELMQLSRTSWPGSLAEVEAFELISSELRPEGPIYATVATFPLATAGS